MMHRTIGELVGDRLPVTLHPTATVRQAAAAMSAAHVASVVVTAEPGGHLEGIFTERDLTERVVANGLDPDATPLGAVMTLCPLTIGTTASVADALRRMHDSGLRHLPIVADGRVVGVVSMRDFMGEEIAALDREWTLMDNLTEVL